MQHISTADLIHQRDKYHAIAIYLLWVSWTKIENGTYDTPLAEKVWDVHCRISMRCHELRNIINRRRYGIK